jgi:hypothetical protein
MDECDMMDQRMLDHGIIQDEESGCNGLRIVAARGVAEPKEDAASTALEEKEQGCTIRLFGTNSLKEGVV